MALRCVRLLLGKEGGGSEGHEKGDAVLEICRSCWMMMALKEKEGGEAIIALDEAMVS